jgi:hypothetical protein
MRRLLSIAAAFISECVEVAELAQMLAISHEYGGQ